MEKLKTYGALLLAMVSCFNLGVYTILTIKHIQEIQIHQWFTTPVVGLYFLFVFIDRIRKEE